MLFPITRRWALLAIACALVATIAAESMTGDSHCDVGYCLTATYSPTAGNINYTLLVSGNGALTGWYGVGQGEKMAGANMLVGWVNSDDSITTSQRSASGHHQPTTHAVTAAAYVMDHADTKVVNGTVLSISWLFPQKTKPSSLMAHMYASSTKAPSSSQQDATIGMHSTYKQFSLAMDKAYSSTSQPATAQVPTASSNVDNGSGRDLANTSTRLYLVHMIFMVVAWLVLAPVGALLGRYGRTLFTWFPAHRGVQLATLVFLVFGFILGVSAMIASGAAHHFDQTHHQVGLAILVLALLQVGLGYGAHNYRAKTGKRYVGMVHAPLGILLVGLSVWNIHTGFELWEWQPGEVASYVLYAWIGLISFLYLSGFLLLPREVRYGRNFEEKRQDSRFHYAYTRGETVE